GASRSKPSPKAVRGRRKTEAESQRKRWTKAKPARRLFMVRREASSAKRTRGGGLGGTREVPPAPTARSMRTTLESVAHASPPTQHRPRRHVFPLGARPRTLHLAGPAGDRGQRRDLADGRPPVLRSDLPLRPDAGRRRVALRPRAGPGRGSVRPAR